MFFVIDFDGNLVKIVSLFDIGICVEGGYFMVNGVW